MYFFQIENLSLKVTKRIQRLYIEQGVKGLFKIS
jgi:hypothetical protein